MKASIGVAAIAVIVLIASALTLVAAGGTAFVFLGPMSSQLFDPAVLPPGADVRLLRAMGIAAAGMFGAFGTVGVITGVGLFRLWRWARYSMIAFGAFMAVTSALTVAFGVAAPMSAAPDMPRGLQIALVVFYLLLAAVGAGLAYFFTRPAIVEQFGGTSGRTHTRPVSVTIIAWLMLISGAMMVPSVLLLSLPAVVVGALVVGAGARLYYAAYMTAYLVIGVGLLRRTRAFLAPAIGLQVFALLNALASLRPGVWSRYLEAVAAAVPSMTLPAASGTHWWTSGAGVVTAGVMVFFLVKAREQSV